MTHPRSDLFLVTRGTKHFAITISAAAVAKMHTLRDEVVEFVSRELGGNMSDGLLKRVILTP